MKSKHPLALVALACIAWATAGQVPSPVSVAGRNLAEKYGPAIVIVQLVKKTTMSYEGQSQTRDSQSEIPGVVISPDGLTVTSLAAGDPSAAYAGMGDEGMSTRSDITEAKLLVSGGQEEVPAKVVLRDKDLDLLFLRPITKPKKPMRALDLHNASSVQLLDPVVLLTRLPKTVNRTLGAKLFYVQGVVQKPRKRYVISSDYMSGDFGSPVLALDGRVVGLLVVKLAMQNSDYTDSPRSYNEGVQPVVVTAADLLKDAVQVPKGTAGTARSAAGAADRSKKNSPR
jgi:hypothetical protein